jgi:hypothetical protein
MTPESVTQTHRAAACDGKIPFATFTAAQLVAVRGSRRGKPRQVYHCAFCHQFHLGRRPATGRRPRPSPSEIE